MVQSQEKIEYALDMNSDSSLETIRETLITLGKIAEKTPHAIALLGAGSAGAEFSRMDQYSDIDFFLIVEDGHSVPLISDNSWFGNTLPIAFAFRDTDHGNKALLENGVFLEFAIFTESELAQFGIPGLRVIWASDDFELPLLENKTPELREISYYLDQALSNLYIGALRLRRGERLAALSMIERSALTNLLVAYRLKNGIPVEDPFNIDRRAEKSFSLEFNKFLQGYEKLEGSLEEILKFAERQLSVNERIAKEIRKVISQ